MCILYIGKEHVERYENGYINKNIIFKNIYIYIFFFYIYIFFFFFLVFMLFIILIFI